MQNERKRIYKQKAMATNNSNHNKYHTNPFLTDYQAPPFDQITDEDFEPAIIRGITEEEEEIRNIVNNHMRPTLGNTVAKLDQSGKILDRTTDVFYNLLSAASDARKEELAGKFAAMLAEHRSNIMLNKGLFLRVKNVYLHPTKSISAEERRLAERTYLGFKRNGALLKDDKKEQLRKLTAEASALTLQFQTNLLHARKKFSLNITDEKQLDGIPESVLETTAATARENGETGWTITLDEPVYGPLLTYCSNRDLRHTIYMAYNSVCLNEGDDCNVQICKRLVNVRREIAQMLGYDTFADYVLEERMAENVQNVYRMFDKLIAHYREPALQEVKNVEDFARKTEGNDFELKAWDFAFYSHKLKLSLFDIDSEMLRPYFELSKVKEGVFSLAKELYGISFSINPDIPVYAAGVTAYDVIDKNKSRLGVLYLDFHPRKGKQGGAWMTNYSPQYINGKTNVRPYVAVVMNFTPPTPQRPSLLTLGEVTTFLHEFGHSLHALFANTTYRSLSGTNVFWDFVELPSQIMENFAVEKKFLSTFAKHYQTGEPMPDELIDKIVKSRNFNVAYSTMRQVSFGLLDMAYYTLDKPFEKDLVEFEHEAMKPAQLLPTVDGTCMTVQFGHIMSGGYAAGYYSYKWAEMLDADAFSEFKEHGTFSKETAERFRNCILSKGGTEPPMVLYKQFRGKEPSIDAMIERDGIKRKESAN